MNDPISRQAVLRCIKESRENIDWGQSEDGDAFLHYSAALYRTIASEECLHTIDAVPVVRCKECKHNYSKKHNKRYNHEDIVCDYFETDGLNDNDFCSYGERSEDGEA